MVMGDILYEHEDSEQYRAFDKQHSELMKLVGTELEVTADREENRGRISEDMEQRIKDFLTQAGTLDGLYIEELDHVSVVMKYWQSQLDGYGSGLFYYEVPRSSDESRFVVLERDVSLEEAAEMVGVYVSDLET